MKQDDGGRICRHVTFTVDEDTRLCESAEQVGMTMEDYLRQQVLHGQATDIDWEVLRQHTEAIWRIEEEIRWYTSNENPNIWLFETDLMLINELLTKIKTMEEKLLYKLCANE